ncbi:hypothetical protein ACI48D_10600 [Massilia sp. LXY-6]|uniref:hypothetical protein n=1 Tax=Massilia sp. LXY-6 TaxID=3379823 RepID=UPI003EE17FCC
MESSTHGVAKRLILSLAAGAALSGCVYAPPYAAPYPATPYSSYDTVPYYSPYAYSYPTYVGPPLSLSFGFYEHSYHGGRGWGGGWGDHRGWGGRH